MRIIFATLFLLLTGNAFSQKDSVTTFGSDNFVDEYQFAIKLTPSASGGLVNYALLRFYSNGSKDVIFLSREEFMTQLCGLQNSPANYKHINYLQKYGIRDSVILDSLWKLRYSVYPYADAQGKPIKIMGWANNPDPAVYFKPSDKQMDILRTFGIREIHDYIYGDYLFSLLKSMLDPNWISLYRREF